MDYRYQGIILGSQEVGEADRIYSVFTLEAGKIRVLGKGVRRLEARLAGFLEPLTWSEIFVSRGKGLGQISGSLIENNFPFIRSHWFLSQKVFEIFQLVEKISSEGQKEIKAFQLLLGYLGTLEKLKPNQKEKAEILTLGFIFKFAQELGYGLEIGKCLGCEKPLKPEKNFFEASRGGFFCPGCFQLEKRGFPCPASSIKFLRIFKRNRIESLTKILPSEKEIGDLKKISSDYQKWLKEV